ncbi:MAG: SRPBCC family protein [Methyloceanibacter sp.]|uniref:SRPBCC family protein n=1 Tax=Methyloceanibacter sp. TaxID=1965321 RepID=UPI003D6CF5C6
MQAEEVKSWVADGRLHKFASRVIPVPPDVAWRVMTDHAGYADVADNLSKVEVVSGEGLGMVRRCHDTGGRSWSETCTVWDDGRAFVFAVHTSAPDYPYPLTELEGHWRVEPVPQGSKVILEFAARAKWGVLGRLLLRLMIGPAERICRRLLERWEDRMILEEGR